jgi:hypothetical protein
MRPIPYAAVRMRSKPGLGTWLHRLLHQTRLRRILALSDLHFGTKYLSGCHPCHRRQAKLDAFTTHLKALGTVVKTALRRVLYGP